MSLQELHDQGYTMNASQWLAVRIYGPQSCATRILDRTAEDFVLRVHRWCSRDGGGLLAPSSQPSPHAP